MPTLSTALLALALSVPLLAASPVGAQSAQNPQETLLLGLSSTGPSASDQESIELALARAIGSLTTLRDERDLDLPTALDLLGCSSLDDACTDALLDLFEASAYVVPELAREDGLLALRLRHVSRTRPETSFDISTPLDRPAATLDLQGRVRSWLQGSASAEVRSSQDGLIVRLDGTVRGQTPLLLTDLAAGTYTLAVELDGASAVRTITVDGPAHHDVRFTRADLARPPVFTPRRTGAIALLVTSAGATAGGLAFAAALGRTQDEFNATFIEREANDLATQGRPQALGAPLLVATALATGTAGTLLLVLPGPGNDDNRAAMRLRPFASPHFVGASLEFGR